jgi:hypothetical protein
MNFNMHDVVRGAIETVNEDTDGIVYVSTGRTNVRGILTGAYSNVAARLQVQAKQHDPLQHERGLNYSNGYYSIWAYGNFSDIERPQGTGGDICNFNGQWWYITQVMEWWPQWCSFEVTRQLNAADIAALLAAIANGANP